MSAEFLKEMERVYPPKGVTISPATERQLKKVVDKSRNNPADVYDLYVVTTEDNKKMASDLLPELPEARKEKSKPGKAGSRKRRKH